MARIRTIKPEFCVSEQLSDCSTNARLVFALMWMFCDDQGIHPAKCKTLKGEIFPLDEKITTAHVQGWIGELVKVGLLREYQVASEGYWQVTGWEKHQRIDKPSHKYPRPLAEDSTNAPRMLADTSPPEGNGKEGKGREVSGETSPPLVLLPCIDGTEAPITQPMVDEWTTAYPATEVLQQLRAMRAWLQANPKNQKTRNGVARFVVRWLSKAQDTAPRAAKASERNAWEGAK